MRRELKEALRRINSEAYVDLDAEKELIVRGSRRGASRRPIPWRRTAGSQARRRVAMLVVAITLVFAVYAFGAGVYYFNKFSLVQVDLYKSKSLVDNELKRRVNLLPNLMIISAEYRTHEKLLYEHVAEMRAYLANLDGKAPSDAGRPLSQLMSSLLAVAEEYPDLKATQSFEQLMTDWTETEGRVAEARKEYIGNIRELNALCTTFPSNVYARFFGVEKHKEFEFDEPGAMPVKSDEYFGAYSGDLKDRAAAGGKGE